MMCMVYTLSTGIIKPHFQVSPGTRLLVVHTDLH